MLPARRALISVYDKRGLAELEKDVFDVVLASRKLVYKLRKAAGMLGSKGGLPQP